MRRDGLSEDGQALHKRKLPPADRAYRLARRLRLVGYLGLAITVAGYLAPVGWPLRTLSRYASVVTTMAFTGALLGLVSGAGKELEEYRELLDGEGRCEVCGGLILRVEGRGIALFLGKDRPCCRASVEKIVERQQVVAQVEKFLGIEEDGQ